MTSEESEVPEDRIDAAEILFEDRPSMLTLAGLDSLDAGNVPGGAPVPMVPGGPIVSERTDLPEGRSFAGGGAAGSVIPSGIDAGPGRSAVVPGTATDGRESTPPNSSPVVESSLRETAAGLDAGSIRTSGSNSESVVTVTPVTGGDPDALPEARVTGSATSRSGDGRLILPDGFQATNAATARPASDRGRPVSTPTSASTSPASGEQRTTRPAAVARAEAVNAAIQAARAEGSGVEVVTSATTTSGPTVVRGGVETAQGMPGSTAGLAPNHAEESGGRTMPGVGRGLDTLARQRGGTLTMRLDPPSLGQLKLEMKMDGARVTVLMTAASDSARSLLRNNMGSLRQALEDRGFAVDRLAVETAGKSAEGTGNSRSESRGDGQDARGGQGASDRQDAGDGRSRGRRDDASGRRAGRGDDLTRQEAANFGETLAEVAVSGN